MYVSNVIYADKYDGRDGYSDRQADVHNVKAHPL